MESSFPLVSVIIPTYNRAWTLAKAIDSVLSQKYTPFELIVIDDGSTDNTASLLAGYGNQLQVIPQENRGVSAARNVGIRRARGELIALLDSDDTWLPKKLKVQVEYFSQHPECLICQTEEIWIRNGVRVNPGKRHRKEAGMIFDKSLALCLVSPSAVMMKKSLLLEDVGLFDERMPACEDYDLWLRVAKKYPIHLIEEALIVKNGGHDDQLSRMPELDKYRIQSIARLLDGNLLSPAQQKAALEMLETKCRIYAQGCRKRDRFKDAKYYGTLVEKYR